MSGSREPVRVDFQESQSKAHNSHQLRVTSVIAGKMRFDSAQRPYVL
jgi:hypothetical protein